MAPHAECSAALTLELYSIFFRQCNIFGAAMPIVPASATGTPAVF
jgi:hypothetical protein